MLDADAVPAGQRNKGWVALATVLHKHGVADQHVTAPALVAIDDLNREMTLSEAFQRQSDAIKELLRSAPVPLKRRPARPNPVTSFRPGDAVAIELDQRFHAAYVLSRAGDAGDTRPVVEFYRGRFDRPPTAEDLKGRAMAREYGRGRFGVFGLTYVPDPANQVVLIASAAVDPPQGAPPIPGRGEWTSTDLLQLQDHIRRLFETDP
jgi:hypothetical protein